MSCLFYLKEGKKSDKHVIRKLGQQEKNVRKLFGSASQVLGKVSYGAVVFVTSDLVLSLKTHTFIIVILFLLC